MPHYFQGIRAPPPPQLTATSRRHQQQKLNFNLP
jgi:hypothetical protein